MTQDDLTPPEPDSADVGHTLAKALMSAVPYIGGPAAELFAVAIVPPLERRRHAWMSVVAERIRKLEANGVSVSFESLAANEEFVTAIMQATHIALRNHQREKLEALQNSVLNVTVGRSPPEDLLMVYLHFVDTLTVWHLKILRFFQDPRAYADERGVEFPSWSGGGPSNVLEHTFPELAGKRGIYDQFVRDLHSRGLLGIENLHVMMTATGMFSKRTTPIGDDFLKFIEAPPEEYS